MQEKDKVKELEQKVQELESQLKVHKKCFSFLESQEKLQDELLRTIRYVEGKGFLIDSPVGFLKEVIHTMSAEAKAMLAQRIRGILDLSSNGVRKLQNDAGGGLYSKIVANLLVEDFVEGNLANFEFLARYIRETLPDADKE